jgi:hypothetical protein
MLRIRIEGLDELVAELQAVEDTLSNIGVTSAIPDAVFPALADEIEQNFDSRGLRHADGIQDGAPFPWGAYKQDWMSINPRIGMKYQGETYYLIESEDLIGSLTILNHPLQRLDQAPQQVILESIVPYAGEVQADYGAYLAAGATMKEAVEDDLQDWLVDNLPGEWVRE